MSYDESDEDGEWEVVDIVHTTTSVKPNKKPKVAKKDDLENLEKQFQAQMSLKTTHDTQQMLMLEQKMKQQQKLSEQQLKTIQSKLAQITSLQQQQDQQQKDIDKQRKELEEKQKQQLLEQQIQIQSLSDHQMLTQKQILSAHQQIQQTQAVTQNVNENIQSLQQIQHQQAIQQQLNEQQIQQQLVEQTQHLQTQQQLAQLAQIAAAAQTQQNGVFPQQPLPQLPPLQQPLNFNIPPPPQNINTNPSNNSNMSGTNNSWLPSFFVFGNGNKNGNPSNPSNVNIQDMDMASSPPLQSMMNEEKANILMDDDDDDVIGWHNDYGKELNVLQSHPELLKTKSVIGEGKFAPNEKRQCGWILQNKSTTLLKLAARLECIGGDKEENGMKISTEKVYEFSLKPQEEVYILIEVEAPSMAGKYCAFYQLVIDHGIKVGEMLEIMCHVAPQFNEKKEKKIAQIIKMGFDDRKKVIFTLQKKKWNVQQTVDELIGL